MASRYLIPDDFKQQLLNRVDIVAVIERYVELRKAGQNYVARCPFHSEKTPSFSVSPSKQFYHCFGCGAHGNAIGFLMEHSGLGYVDAVKELAASVGLSVPEIREAERHAQAAGHPDHSTMLAAAAQFYKQQLKRSEQAIGYLKQRGVSGEIAARFGLGYAPPGWQGLNEVFADYRTSAALKETGLVIDAESGRRYDRFRDRIMFPIVNGRGVIVGFGGRVLGDGEPKYLNSPETPLFEKGRELYGLHLARQALRAAGYVVVVEGYMDVVALAQHGVGAAVATLGTATTAAHVETLLRLTDQIVFCFDADAAGRRAAWRALEISLPKLSDDRSVSFLFLPEGEDPDSYVRAHGREGFEARVGEALPLSELLVRELSGRVDLKSAEGRARLLHAAKPLLKQITAPTLALMLRKRFAQTTGIGLEEIDELLEIPRPRAAVGRPAGGVSAARRQGPASLTQWLLQAVLLDPMLASQVDSSTLDLSDRSYPALVALLELVAAHPQISAKAIVPLALEAIEDPAIAEVLRSAQVEVLDGPDLDIRNEFAHALTALRDRQERRRLKELSDKTERTAAEQAELEQLFKTLSARAKQPTEEIASRV